MCDACIYWWTLLGNEKKKLKMPIVKETPVYVELLIVSIDLKFQNLNVSKWSSWRQRKWIGSQTIPSPSWTPAKMQQPLRRGFYQYTPLSNPPLPSQSFSPQAPAVINHLFLNWSLGEYLWKGEKRYSIHTIKDSGWMVFVWRQRGIHTDGDAVRNLCVCVRVCLCVLGLG